MARVVHKIFTVPLAPPESGTTSKRILFSSANVLSMVAGDAGAVDAAAVRPCTARHQAQSQHRIFLRYRAKRRLHKSGAWYAEEESEEVKARGMVKGASRRIAEAQQGEDAGGQDFEADETHCGCVTAAGAEAWHWAWASAVERPNLSGPSLNQRVVSVLCKYASPLDYSEARFAVANVITIARHRAAPMDAACDGGRNRARLWDRLGSLAAFFPRCATRLLHAVAGNASEPQNNSQNL